MTKVVYLLGYGRSGSTVLGNVLGEVDGLFYAGELRHLWSRGLAGGWTCGCGRLVRECEIWSQVASRVLGTGDPRHVVALRNDVVRWRNLSRLLRARGRGRTDWPARDELVDIVRRMYAAVSDVTGSDVIVDSSKDPVYAALVGGLPGIDMRFVHLVRDPRAVAFSWGRRRPSAGSTAEQMPRYAAGASARAWVVWNVASKRVTRVIAPRGSVRVRYEELVARPREELDRILRLVGRSADDLAFVTDRSVRLGIHHTVSGNPVRFDRGDTQIRLDDEWRAAQRPRDRWIATAITLPFLGSYGYPVRVPKGPPR